MYACRFAPHDRLSSVVAPSSDDRTPPPSAGSRILLSVALPHSAAACPVPAALGRLAIPAKPVPILGFGWLEECEQRPFGWPRQRCAIGVRDCKREGQKDGLIQVFQNAIHQPAPAVRELVACCLPSFRQVVTLIRATRMFRGARVPLSPVHPPAARNERCTHRGDGAIFVDITQAF